MRYQNIKKPPTLLLEPGEYTTFLSVLENASNLDPAVAMVEPAEIAGLQERFSRNSNDNGAVVISLADSDLSGLSLIFAATEANSDIGAAPEVRRISSELGEIVRVSTLE